LISQVCSSERCELRNQESRDELELTAAVFLSFLTSLSTSPQSVRFSTAAQTLNV
jgi:hypothetical protein